LNDRSKEQVLGEEMELRGKGKRSTIPRSREKKRAGPRQKRLRQEEWDLDGGERIGKFPLRGRKEGEWHRYCR